MQTTQETHVPVSQQIAEIEATVYAARERLRLIALYWDNRELAQDADDLALELARIVEAVNRLRVFAECEQAALRSIAGGQR